MREPIVVLHAAQHVEVNLDEVFPPGRYEVVVVTTGDVSSIWRPGVSAGSARVVHSDHAPDVGFVTALFDGVPQVVTNDEFCIELCARLRREAGLATHHPRHIDAYRNKVTMKDRLLEAGIATSPYRQLQPDQFDADELVAALGTSIVLKPEEGANSRGVTITRGRDALAAWMTAHSTGSGWFAESLIEGRHGHVNSVVRQGDVEHVCVGLYTDALIRLSRANPVGGTTVSRSDRLWREATTLSESVIRALGDDGDFVTHTEFVQTDTGELVVLESAARAPGALISETTVISAGLHLVAANYRLQAGHPVAPAVETGMEAGWLWFPAGRESAETLRRPFIGSSFRLSAAGIVAPNERRGLTLAASMIAWNNDGDRLRQDLHEVARLGVLDDLARG